MEDITFLRDEDPMTKIYKKNDMIIVLYLTGETYDSSADMEDFDFMFKKGCVHVSGNFIDKSPDNLTIWGDEKYMEYICNKFDV